MLKKKNSVAAFNGIIPILVEVEKEEEEEKDEIFYDSLNTLKIKKEFELKEQNKAQKNNLRKFFIDESEKNIEERNFPILKSYGGSYKMSETVAESVKKLIQDPVIITEIVLEEESVVVAEIVSRPGTGAYLILEFYETEIFVLIFFSLYLFSSL